MPQVLSLLKSLDIFFISHLVWHIRKKALVMCCSVGTGHSDKLCGDILKSSKFSKNYILSKIMIVRMFVIISTNEKCDILSLK